LKLTNRKNNYGRYDITPPFPSRLRDAFGGGAHYYLESQVFFDWKKRLRHVFLFIRLFLFVRLFSFVLPFVFKRFQRFQRFNQRFLQ